MRAHDTAKIIAQGNNFPVEDIVLLDGLKEKGMVNLRVAYLQKSLGA